MAHKEGRGESRSQTKGQRMKTSTMMMWSGSAMMEGDSWASIRMSEAELGDMGLERYPGAED